jgi:hypothetical protein
MFRLCLWEYRKTVLAVAVGAVGSAAVTWGTCARGRGGVESGQRAGRMPIWVTGSKSGMFMVADLV